MRAIVTGCAGFIGSHLTEKLLSEGWQVTGIDSCTEYYDQREKEANLALLAGNPAFELVRADLCDAPLDQLMADRPAVFHLAGQPGVRGSFGTGFDQYVHHNIEATQRIFEAALATRTPRVVYASSSSVYGDAAAYPCVEDTTQLRPRSPYGVTKQTCEQLGDVYAALGLETVGLRYFTVYGPRQRPDMAMRRLCEAAFGGEPFVLYGDGLQSRDFTHVSDVVTATIAAAAATRVDAILNIGGGHEATMNEVIEHIADLAGPLDIRRGAVQRGDVRRTGADTSRVRTQLSWAPRTELAEGLATEVDWVRANHDAASKELVDQGASP